MSQTALTAYTRKFTGKSNTQKLRREHKIPAVLYGASGNTALEMEEEATRHFMERLSGLHQLVPLKIINAEVGTTTEHQVIIQEIQKHVYKPKLVHLDFRELDAKKPVTLRIPIKVVGEAPALKKGGAIQIVMRKLQLICSPSNIPAFISVDVSNLDFGNVLRVQEIQLPENVKLKGKQNYTVISAVGRKQEEAPVAEAAPKVEAAPKTAE